MVKFLEQPKKLQERTKCEISCSLISNYATELQLSKQYSTGIKMNTQINGVVQNPEINPPLCGKLYYDKESKDIQLGKNSLFNKWCWETGQKHAKKIELNHLLKPKTTQKWIKGLNVRLETINLLEGKIGSKLFDTSLSNIFLDMPPWERATKVKINR